MKNLPAPQQATIDAQKLAYRLSGDGTPTIVLINGSGGPMEGWFRLYPAIEELGRVLAWDRPGAGASGAPRRAQTGVQVVADLRGLLAQLQLAPPYLLVAHSFGGLHAQLFARLHPEEVAGVVFLEATSPDDVEAMKQLEAPLPRAINGALRAFSRPDPHDEVSNETVTVAQIREAGPFPAIPVCVVSGGKRPPGWLSSAAALARRDEHQSALAALSPVGRRRIARRSGHFPQINEPDEVLAAIRQCLADHAAERSPALAEAG